MAFRKSLYDTVGPFDESLWPCCGEEIDFCFRAAEYGFRTGIATGCYVHHEGSVTFKNINGEHPYNDIVDRNDKHLADRWGDDWSKQDVGIGVKPVGCSLNLGCGLKHLDGFVNIDNRSETDPDLVCDVTGGLPYEDNSVDLVRADDFLEHIPIGKVIPLMNEIWRVLKPDGIFESSTPSTDGRGAFQDPTHVSFWNRNSWEYYSKKPVRELYGIVADFDIENIEDIDTDPSNMVIHTHVIARARK
jgi:SAM-dependent methyltransferase